jgi:hypothetical protein
MLLTPFDEFPDSARVWVYGVDRDMAKRSQSVLLDEVDNYLTQWTAHGEPLSAARDWRDDHFLTIAVDQKHAGASGCSIDELFRTLKAVEGKLGAVIVTSGLIFFRDKDKHIRSVTRDEFSELGVAGEVSGDTEVFDPSVTTLGEWRSRFASRAADSWHASLLPPARRVT